MADHAHELNGGEVQFDGKLDRLIVRFEGLLGVCKLLERRGASEAELDQHRLELERVSWELASLVRQTGHGRPRPARPSPAEPASTRRELHAAVSPPIRPRIGDATPPRPRAASPRPEEHDPMASTI